MEDEPSPNPYYKILKKSCISLCIVFLIMVGYQEQKNTIGSYNEAKREQQYNCLDIYEIHKFTRNGSKANKYLNRDVLVGLIELPILLRITWLIGCSRYICDRIRIKLCLILQKSKAPPFKDKVIMIK